MAASSVDRSPLPAQVVGKAFVQQYYLILQQSPELVHRFYQENSLLSRPDANGEMSLVTTTQAINQKVLSMGAVRAETNTVDAQESLGGGVTVLVTGYLSEVDSIKRGFTQSFFLAPQDKGFFVLNDIFRFVEEDEHQQGNQGCPPQQGPHDLDQTASEDDDKLNSGEVYNPPEDGQFVEHEEPKEEVINEVPNSSHAVVVEPTPVTAQEDMPKKSYASIVKVMKHSALASIPPHMLSKSASVRLESEATTAPSAVPANDVPTTNSVNEESSNAVEAEADGHSIFVKSLPLDATPDQLEQEFKKFGTIMPDGIQVRSHKLQGFCYGFVTFETASAVQKSLEASPIMIGGRPAYVKEKRTTDSRVGNQGRYLSGRGGGLRYDTRGRSSFSGRRAYGRGDYDTPPDFGGRGGGRGRYQNRASDGSYKRVDRINSSSSHGTNASFAIGVPTKN
ncbi:nuclear transport factor 2-like [Zingiber officinale]|uniref:nuclear transport factor 2-like n=1 Tax=Zingiber officinale TaxID=94328 RepID=UPI001C4D963D|nr:nuclear transport factor 2-like [Zingiber officinale]XP_042428111.1 nuclear transport factor 2-like [Zingiber officinale]XP_042428112.1 nuclear transport factor 2-like [Zingiber officinale]XP_042428113.1 nuclear transport factor 2-like [Zingiber officinale]